MLNKIIISALLIVSMNLYSQTISDVIDAGCTIRGIPSLFENYPRNGSGYIYKFEEENIEKIRIHFNSSYEIGRAAYYNGKFQTAKSYLNEYISKNIPFDDTLNGLQNSYLFRELKNNACGILKNIYLKEGDYEKAIYFHDLQMSKYRLWEFCGGSWIDNKYFKEDLFPIMVYEKKGDIHQALMKIKRYAGHRDNSINQIAVPLFYTLLQKKYTKEEIRSSMIDGVRNAYPLFSNFVVSINGYELRILSPHIINYKMDEKFGFIPYSMTNDEFYEAHKKFPEDFEKSLLYKIIMEN